MGLFGKKQPPPPPPTDRRKVMNLISLGMKETDAADRDVDSPAFLQAKARFDKALGEATQAEKGAAFKALRKNGY